jgi:hypothetical protein
LNDLKKSNVLAKLQAQIDILSKYFEQPFPIVYYYHPSRRAPGRMVRQPCSLIAFDQFATDQGMIAVPNVFGVDTRSSNEAGRFYDVLLANLDVKNSIYVTGDKNRCEFDSSNPYFGNATIRGLRSHEQTTFGLIFPFAQTKVSFNFTFGRHLNELFPYEPNSFSGCTGDSSSSKEAQKNSTGKFWPFGHE